MKQGDLCWILYFETKPTHCLYFSFSFAGPTTYQYDARNRLVSVDGGDTAEYGYNAMGARAFKRTQETYQISADLNQDGRKSVADLLTLLEIIHHRESPVRADLNQDGKVNHRDISCMATHLTHNWFLERFLHCRFGQQIETVTKTRFVYDGASLMGEYDDQGNARQEIVWAGSKPVGLLEDGELYYVSSNQIDAPVAITDQSGELLWQWDLRPFGDSLPDEDVDGDGRDLKFNLRFPGQYWDNERGLYYNYYRDYDPSIGRLVQSDPIGLRGGINTYVYVGGNPINYIDSYGKSATAVVGGWIGTDTAIPDPTDVAWPKWLGYGAALGGAALVDWLIYNNEDISEDNEWCPGSDEVPELDWNDPSKPPISPDGAEWPWRGPDAPGGKRGGYVNPDNPDVSVHPDLDHAPPVGPHWDYTDRKKGGARVYPDGSVKPK
ncbi:hypothetical protein EZI54_17735 [Marinobacter halodurans]|uniref:Bacterial toxin 37 domain-containing protein n=1 Tax=Marinobacter halodurans TaxID=2528979 RepID=A0ABY1ZG68_9GAMM|nr:RHS repeat-associated core domain-containing protein [Marinobacter halodurans]TBW50741.1 hypothetical protein EZI54_17735 [Marinobacter halodurans]